MRKNNAQYKLLLPTKELETMVLNELRKIEIEKENE